MSDLIEREASIEAVCNACGLAGLCLENKLRRKKGAVCDSITALRSVPVASRWVRCEEELPVKGEIVIVSDGKRTWDVGQYRCLAFSDDRTKWWWKGHTIKTVKWWMRKKDALPEPPREGE